MERILVIRGTGEGRGTTVKKGSRWAMLTPAATEGSKCISDTGDLAQDHVCKCIPSPGSQQTSGDHA